MWPYKNILVVNSKGTNYNNYKSKRRRSDSMTKEPVRNKFKKESTEEIDDDDDVSTSVCQIQGKTNNIDIRGIIYFT